MAAFGHIHRVWPALGTDGCRARRYGEPAPHSPYGTGRSAAAAGGHSATPRPFTPASSRREPLVGKDLHGGLGRGSGGGQAALDAEPLLIAGRRTGGNLRGGAIRPPRAAGASRTQGVNARTALLVRESARNAAPRVL